MENKYIIHPIGVVHSSLKSREECPRQGHEGAPDAWIEIDPAYSDAIDGLSKGQEIVILTWLHEANRNVLKVHPRGDVRNPLRGVFLTRSPDRPNPIGLHRVEVLEMIDRRIRVKPLEVIDGTPVIDIKPLSGGINNP
jgi:tRNA-Thr(GGU) m(6)t(6)A37 methyltransferase TsaA